MDPVIQDLETPIGSLFEDTPEGLVYIGSFPRQLVLEKILAMNLLRLRCGHTAVHASVAYTIAISKEAGTIRDQLAMRTTVAFWQEWFSKNACFDEGYDDRLKAQYLKRVGELDETSN